jgi:hypothetical protein
MTVLLINAVYRLKNGKGGSSLSYSKDTEKTGDATGAKLGCATSPLYVEGWFVSVESLLLKKESNVV